MGAGDLKLGSTVGGRSSWRVRVAMGLTVDGVDRGICQLVGRKWGQPWAGVAVGMKGGSTGCPQAQSAGGADKQ